MKKVIVIVILLAVIAYGVYWVKNSLKKVTVDVDNFDITSITDTTAKGFVTIKVFNPFFDVDLSNLKAQIFIEGQHFSDLEQKELQSTVKDGSIYITANFTVNLKKFSINNILKLLDKGNKNYNVNGSIKVKKWGVSYDVPIDYTDTFKLK